MRLPFFEDFASSVDSTRHGVCEVMTASELPIWVNDARAAEFLRSVLRDPEDVEKLAEFVVGFVTTALHSALVTIDGGSASAAVGRVELVDEAGESLGGWLA